LIYQKPEVQVLILIRKFVTYQYSREYKQNTLQSEKASGKHQESS